ncbi:MULTISPECIES: hypothetical protein [Ralstonia solanacearum species complex]|uniref:Uncharacterized protein n=2 Tax=Ralstonia solanacearum TaxID=305 RepID=A0A1C0ULM4_RALSL|nr:hypothetical protein [Ralstonia solanacearum]AEG71041.1 conserved hypothetical protein [Ralstonia solanacearum Po82]ALF90775.1 hypothetical protein RSUY_44720 [Ralstonia solanacearum]AMP72132.1 hypothetical protein UW163_22100 [Ralstonia solanacearum]AMP76620.1 hypothetical protein RALBFv3_20955 [Ralstonia solanacearum]ATI30206.1 hypothetical protein CCY86_22500 [Ralstonia solanacearum]
MEAHPSATYKGYDIYPLVYKHTAERAWGERRPGRSFEAAVVICREGLRPEGEQARTFRLSATPWESVGEARRGALRYAEEIINGLVAGESVASL